MEICTPLTVDGITSQEEDLHELIKLSLCQDLSETQKKGFHNTVKLRWLKIVGTVSASLTH